MVRGKGGLSGIRSGGIPFGGLRLQGQPDGFSVRHIFEDSCTEEGIGSGKAIFEGRFKFVSSDAGKNFYSTASKIQR